MNILKGTYRKEQISNLLNQLGEVVEVIDLEPQKSMIFLHKFLLSSKLLKPPLALHIGFPFWGITS